MRFILLALFAVVALSASVYISDDKQIKNTILKYNYGIIKMGKSGETQFFKEFVKEDVAVKLQVWFESWKFSNLTYVANINDLIFSPIEYNENNATITTFENWTFTYVNLLTKDVALERPVNILYKMKFTLEKKQDSWMIVDIKKLQEKKIAKPALKPLLKPNKPEEISDIKQKIPTH